ncbi:MAG: hypothetical protein HGA45_10350 [Chloroflexales bacterium]|nr:hypothetical protein [Chloroflexales bacterium]
MTTLSVLTFGALGGAGQACDLLIDLEQQGVVTLQAVVHIWWPLGHSQPQICPLLIEASDWDYESWSDLCARLLDVPRARAVGGEATGHASYRAHAGGDDMDIPALATITVGASALVIQSQEALASQAIAALGPLRPAICAVDLQLDSPAVLAR